jgi:hypothetical protein
VVVAAKRGEAVPWHPRVDCTVILPPAYHVPVRQVKERRRIS